MEGKEQHFIKIDQLKFLHRECRDIQKIILTIILSFAAFAFTILSIYQNREQYVFEIIISELFLMTVIIGLSFWDYRLDKKIKR